MLSIHCSSPIKLSHQTPIASRITTRRGWTFTGGSRVVMRKKTQRLQQSMKILRPNCYWPSSPQFPSDAFTLGTIGVLPFYTLMVLAPNSEMTKKAMESSAPYIILGTFYLFVLYNSWTPDTFGLLFSSKDWMPELSSVAKIFSSEIGLATAWLHLMVVDLFGARQIYRDGLEKCIETRHSIFMCLFCCPMGIIFHVITKMLVRSMDREN